jgi:hypothetical protein
MKEDLDKNIAEVRSKEIALYEKSAKLKDTQSEKEKSLEQQLATS